MFLKILLSLAMLSCPAVAISNSITGFEQGDIILEINGQKLDNAAEAIKTLKSLKNENHVVLLVKKKDGTIKKIEVDIE